MECQKCEDDNKPEKTMCGCDFLRHKKMSCITNGRMLMQIFFCSEWKHAEIISFLSLTFFPFLSELKCQSKNDIVCICASFKLNESENCDNLGG